MAKKKTVEIYIQIRKGSGKHRDTVQHTATEPGEAIAFITEHA